LLERISHFNKLVSGQWSVGNFFLKTDNGQRTTDNWQRTTDNWQRTTDNWQRITKMLRN